MLLGGEAAGGCVWWEEQAGKPKRSRSPAPNRLGEKNPCERLEEEHLIRLLFRMFVEAAGSGERVSRSQVLKLTWT